jgi:hypothetical protein
MAGQLVFIKTPGMKSTITFILLLLSLLNIPLHAQLTPEKPPLSYVTVDVETGNDIIVWNPSPSIDILDYYKVVEERTTTDGQPPVMTEIPTEINKSETSFVNPNTESGSHSVGYSVIAVNDLGGGLTTMYRSLYDSAHYTIYLAAEMDSCMASVILTWNKYNNWHGSIAEYNIYRRIGPGIYDKLITLAEGVTTHTFTTFQVNQHYDLFVEAVHDDGRRSTSNRIDVLTNLADMPSYINADYATIGLDNSINLSFTVDASSSYTFYYLARSTNPEGEFTRIDSFDTHDARINYTDEVRFTSNIYYYRLEVLSNCSTVALSSNRANNIILNGSNNSTSVSLQWNEYRDWLGGVDQYRIIRRTGRSNPVTDTLNAGIVTAFNDDVSHLINYEDPTEGLICYSVLAIENLNMYGVKGNSLSNEVCFSINPDIRIPNAFIPNDAEPANQVFEPVFSFLPERYEIMIYNRLGLKIWEGSQGWDGRANGKYVPEGVYLYFIRVINQSTDIIELNGKVTVLYR